MIVLPRLMNGFHDDDFQALPIKLSQADTFKFIDMEVERRQMIERAESATKDEKEQLIEEDKVIPSNITCHCEGKRETEQLNIH